MNVPLLAGLSLLAGATRPEPCAADKISELRRFAFLLVGAFLLLTVLDSFVKVPELETWKMVFMSAVAYLLGRSEKINEVA